MHPLHFEVLPDSQKARAGGEMTRIDVLKCKICARLQFLPHEKILLGFMSKCPLCGGELDKKESIYQIEKKGV